MHSENSTVSPNDDHVRYSVDAVGSLRRLSAVVGDQHLKFRHLASELAVGVERLDVDGYDLNTVFPRHSSNTFQQWQFFATWNAP